jgi:hypothetical protein
MLAKINEKNMMKEEGKCKAIVFEIWTADEKKPLVDVLT